MEILIKKLTDVDLMRRACEMTMNGGKESKATLRGMYDCEHSPCRTQLFWIEMLDIPSFVSTHFVRHKIGVEHFVKTNRDDRGGTNDVTRMTPVNHGMLINAQALIGMARKRLCIKSHPETIKVMRRIKDILFNIDPDLALCLIPECEYRGNFCHENKGCGKCPHK